MPEVTDREGAPLNPYPPPPSGAVTNNRLHIVLYTTNGWGLVGSKPFRTIFRLRNTLVSKPCSSAMVYLTQTLYTLVERTISILLKTYSKISPPTSDLVFSLAEGPILEVRRKMPFARSGRNFFQGVAHEVDLI